MDDIFLASAAMAGNVAEGGAVIGDGAVTEGGAISGDGVESDGASVDTGFAALAEPPVIYKQLSYEELEECVLCVRDSISEFYLAPQGEISFAAVEAAQTAQTGQAAQTALTEQIAQNTQSTHAALPDVLSISDALSALEAATIINAAPAADVAFVADATPSADVAYVAEAQLISDETPTLGINESVDNRAGVQKPYIMHSAPIHQLYRESIKKRERKRKKAALKFAAACFGCAALGSLLMLLCIAVILPALGYAVYIPSPRSAYMGLPNAGLDGGESQIEAIYEKVLPCVAVIRVKDDYGDYIFGQRQSYTEVSGIIIRPDGYILTNYQAIAAAIPTLIPGTRSTGYEVVTYSNPGAVYSARLVARDLKTGVAVIKIDAEGLPVADLGDSDLLRPGEAVVAVGRQGGTVTDGIVSGFQRDAATGSELGPESEISLIQTSALINRGNNGGALVNAQGQVVGINIPAGEAQGYDGLGFAIPINAARFVAENLIEFNYVRGRAKTGIVYSEAYNDDYEMYKKQFPNLPEGVYVERVEPLSGAFKAGIRAGDIVTGMRGEAVNDYLEMLAVKYSLAPGDVIDVVVYRAGEYLTVELEVSEETGEGAGAD